MFCLFYVLSFNILSFRYFATAIYCLLYFETLIFCICTSIFFFSIFYPFNILLSIFRMFTILQFDIMHIRYFAIRYSALLIFCPIDILQFRYFVTSIFYLSIYCARYSAIQYFAIKAKCPPPPLDPLVVTSLTAGQCKKHDDCGTGRRAVHAGLEK